MSLTYFISDLHLSESRPDITQAFIRFIEQTATKAEKLYVLGDLFEVWVGDDNDNSFTQTVKSAFAKLSESGTEIFYIHGNRDFLIGERFAQQAKLTLLPEQTVIDLYGTPVIICHGDELCTLDTAYQEYRTRSRSAEWQQNIMSKPLWIRRLIGRYARIRSYLKYRFNEVEIGDVEQHSVEQMLDKFGVFTMIHGHTHRPAVHQFELSGQDAKRIVLGDWYSQSSALKVTPDNIELIAQQL